MYKRIVSLIAVFIICCISVISVSASAVTEPVTSPAEQPTEQSEPKEKTSEFDNHTAVCFILLAVSMGVGCKLAQGFSFWKW